jgi:hypothetical protein
MLEAVTPVAAMAAELLDQSLTLICSQDIADRNQGRRDGL